MNERNFGVNLKKARCEQGITQPTLAKMLNVSNGTVGNWESGTRKPDIDMLGNIADALGVSADYLIGRGDAYFDRERAIIAAYRARPEMRAAVDTLLGIAPDIADDIIDTITKKARTSKS